MSQLVYKIASLNEINSIRSLFKSAVLAVSSDYYSEAEKVEWASTSKNLNRWKTAINDQYFLLTYLNEKLVGFISVDQNNYIDFIYVHPKFLGKGIAQAMYAKIEKVAILQHAKELTSHVSKAAIGFFEKIGFQILQENQNERNGEILINYTVVKKL